MNEIETIKIKSKNLAKVIIAEFAYCSFLYFGYKVFLKKSNLIDIIYLGLLIVLPFVFNMFLYFRSKKNSNFIDAHNLVIVQILILFYSFKFLIS